MATKRTVSRDLFEKAAHGVANRSWASAFDLAVGRVTSDIISSMQMQIEYPDSLPDLLQTTRPEFEAEARMAMAVREKSLS